jgi:crotonobetainyl-CoA:carnitine CoA-transferase CaiB-like acyl-CoA transferase
MDGLPLSGITVVELCHSVAGPYAGAILADLGADVIKIENPDGGDYARDWGPPFAHGVATLFQVLNRNKAGITLNLRDPGARQQLQDLILTRADAFIQNLRPGTVAKLGLGPDDLLPLKPELIYCDLGAFGQTGPLKSHPGYDPLMQAFGGLMSVTGTAGGEPVRVGTSIIDMGSGMWAAMGILAALQRRHATGRGGHVATSLFETSLAWMAPHITGYLATGHMRPRMGSGVSEIVPHQAFATSDGHVMVAAGNDNLFGLLVRALDRPELASDPLFATNSARVANRQDLIAILEKIFAAGSTAEWLRRLDAVGVPSAPIQSVDEVVSAEQTQAIGMLQKLPDLDLTLVGVPLSFDGVRPACRRSAPGLGEHNDVLKTLQDKGEMADR